MNVEMEAARSAIFLPVLEPLRILAVEDEPEVLDLVRAMLTHAGHSVVGAASGREALGLFDKDGVDLVITDLGMSGMTGLALAEQLKAQRPIPVVLMTTSSPLRHREGAPGRAGDGSHSPGGVSA